MSEMDMNSFYEIISEKNVDWDLFDRKLMSLPDINRIYDEETILSELYHECYDGKVLVEATKRFLDHGYDVTANNGLNGSICLHNLCWSTYDKYIVDTAKLLLAAGADPKLSFDDEEENGVKHSIGWRLGGDWAQGSYTVANIFEAYWQLVEAFEEGKDYHSICTFDGYVGEPLLRADVISAKPILHKGTVTGFDGHLVLWFGEKPLVISKYVDFVVNPVLVQEKRTKTVAVDRDIAPLLHARLNGIVFIDSCTAQLQFDNGKYLLISNTDYRDQEHRWGFYEILAETQPANLIGKKIDSILLRPGRQYSDTCDSFSESSAVLLCGDETFLLHAYPETYCEKHEIRTVKCSRQFTAGYKRKILLSDLNYEVSYDNRQKLSGIRMSSNAGYFYLYADKNNELQLKLTEEKYNSWEELSRTQKSKKLSFDVDLPGGGLSEVII